MLTKIRILIFFAVCLTLTSATPGMKISRSFTDTSSVFRSLIAGPLGNVTLASMGNVTYATKDVKKAVTMTLTNIKLLNSTINPAVNMVNVLMSAPNYINITLGSFQGLIQFNYSEVGSGINLAGIGFLTFSTNVTLYNRLSSTTAGIPVLTVANLTYNITTYTIKGLTLLTAAINATVQTNLLTYLNTNANTFFLSAFQSKITTYLNSVNYWKSITGTSLRMDLTWSGNSVISYAPALFCGQNYLTSYFNGTSTSKTNSSYVIPGINPPVALPDRFIANTYVGSSQIMISGYAIESYYYSTLQVYPHYFIQSLPSGFPTILNTGSGYFPELNKAYNNAPLNLNVTFSTLPTVSIIPNYGMQGKLTMSIQTLVYNGNQWIYPLSFNVVMTYSINLYFENNMIKGYSYMPKVSSVTQSNSLVGNVDPYYLATLSIDLFKNFVIYQKGVYFFPQFSLPYPSGTVFNNVRIRMQSGYVVVDYDPVIPNPVSGKYLEDDYLTLSSLGC